jgi:thiol-disulfide isomerase/thioredoxin
LINGIKNAKVGGFYTDFSAKTPNDKMILLSETISKNKLTLIDLWAPWCGPCIAKDKLLKPEYSRLKEKGFEVFAVLGGIKEKKSFTETKDKYNYPWKLNYELNEEFKIWEKYNISRSGGSQFLVNSKGKILAINPYPKEIDSLLNIIN